MKIALITLFPEMFAALTDYGVSGRAVKEGLVEVASFNPRDYTEDRHQTVDARPYGGGPGMVMLIEPLRRALTAAREWTGQGSLVVYLSPQGKVLNQRDINSFATKQSLILIAGR
jgi:tRNA (guanine37-N1)-methyltransferase